ncbi:MAG: D-alanyl-D-alanine carboxypeptidase/D-alanyl-D-alanine-endopeptidase [Deltaproteobacteria bacterium]|nr:D-alanyl-D-alanine carboxypeptidase/D-alanyl-D-alanine-endopeptidase [Deltaproteobacteria bacterium]
MISRLARLGLAVVTGTLSLSFSASAARGDITKALTQGGYSVQQGVLVTRLSDGKVLFEREADTLLAPASLTKVLTSAAALVKWSPVHTLPTTFFHTGQRKGPKISGDLVVVGNGDPFVVSEKLWQLAADIRGLGISEFAGDLVIDNSLFDDESRDESREEGRLRSRHAYDAPVSAFGVNFNTYAVGIAPGEKPGHAASVSLDPYPLGGVIIENKVTTTVATGSKPKTGTISVTRQVRKDGVELLKVTGQIAADWPTQKIYRSVANDLTAAGAYVRAFLKNEGINVRGTIKAGVKPANATPLISMDSYEMRRIVAGLNTFSNNFIADVLIKRLGADFPTSGQPGAPRSGTFSNGLAVLKDFLVKDVGIKTNFVLENGSGLDTDNRLSARQINAVLAHMERHMDVFPDFLASLPATGWDGTLKKRFNRSATEEFKGMFRAKTGTLTEPIAVSGIAGYFRHPTQGMVSFCVIENGHGGQRQPSVVDLRNRQDHILTAFLNDL